jgi:hypothetical protein
MTRETSSPDMKARCEALGAARFEDEEEQRNFFVKIPRNPLKRLISDERIQGNPSFSNPPWARKSKTIQENTRES